MDQPAASLSTRYTLPIHSRRLKMSEDPKLDRFIHHKDKIGQPTKGKQGPKIGPYIGPYIGPI